VFLNENARASLSERDISFKSLNQISCILVDVSYIKLARGKTHP
jgi:hypothetical protein